MIMFQSSFFAHFMCFEVPTLDVNKSGHNDDDDLGIADIDENDSKSGTFTSLSTNILFECFIFYN